MTSNTDPETEKSRQSFATFPKVRKRPQGRSPKGSSPLNKLWPRAQQEPTAPRSGWPLQRKRLCYCVGLSEEEDLSGKSTGSGPETARGYSSSDEATSDEAEAMCSRDDTKAGSSGGHEAKTVCSGDPNSIATSEATSKDALLDCSTSAASRSSLAESCSWSEIQGQASQRKATRRGMRKGLALALQPSIPEDRTETFPVDTFPPDMRSRKHVSAAERQAEAAEQLGIRRSGFYFLEVAQSSSDLASLFQAQGRFKEAEILVREALNIHEQALGSDHPDIAADCEKLGKLLRDAGQLREATKLYCRSLKINDMVLGSWHKDIAAKCINLGVLLKAQGELLEAEALFRRAVAILEWCKPEPGDLDVSVVCSNLWQVLRDLGRADEADQFLQSALAILPISADDLPAVAPREKTLAHDLLTEAKDVKDKTSISIADPLLAVKDNDACQTPLDDSGPVCLIGGWADAVQQIESALQRGIHRLGVYTLDMAKSSTDFCALLHSHEKLCESEWLLRQALVKCERALDSEHLDTLADCNKLGHLLRDCGQFHQAAKLLRQSLEMCDGDLEPGHTEISIRCSNLGFLLKAQGELDKAEPLFRRALMVLEQAKADDFDVAVGCSNLGQVVSGLGKFDEAEQLFRKALTIHAGIPGRLDLASASTSSAQLLKLRSQLKQAESLLCRAVRASERCLGSEHPIMVTRCNNLGKLRMLRKKYTSVEVLQELAESLAIE